MKEYAFDITLSAVARIKANSEQEARRILAIVSQDCFDLNHDTEALTLTEASIIDECPELFEVDGEAA